MSTYELEFLEEALKEWNKLNSAIRNQFSRKLAERIRNPHVPSARLSGIPGCYKIKLRSSGFRLVYQVEDNMLVVVVVAVGKRDKSNVYRKAAFRRPS